MPNDYVVGYRKPPQHSKFKPGVSGNLEGGRKHAAFSFGEIIRNVLNFPVAFREGGRVKYATRQELMLKMIVDAALKGDLSAADFLLTLRTHANRFGDAGAMRILVSDWLPDHPAQTAEEKTKGCAKTSAADPEAWWKQATKVLQKKTD